MADALTGGRLVIASHNSGKVREIADLLRPFALDVVGAAALGLAEPEETGDTFIANAALKARAAATASGLPALADDSGLVVPALDGAPGIHSARWAGPERDFAAAMERVNAALPDDADRAAWFACVLALAWPDGRLESFSGRVDGRLVWPPRGTHGFGYDPIFEPDPAIPSANMTTIPTSATAMASEVALFTRSPSTIQARIAVNRGAVLSRNIASATVVSSKPKRYPVAPIPIRTAAMKPSRPIRRNASSVPRR